MPSENQERPEDPIINQIDYQALIRDEEEENAEGLEDEETSFQHLISPEERERLDRLANHQINTQMVGWLAEVLAETEL